MISGTFGVHARLWSHSDVPNNHQDDSHHCHNLMQELISTGPDKNHNSRGFPPFRGLSNLFQWWITPTDHQLIGWIYGFSKHWKRVEAKRWIKLALLHVPHIATGTPCNSQVLENLLCFKHLWVLRKQARAGSQLNESQVAATAMQHEQCSLYYGGGPKIGGTAKLSSVIGFSIITPL